MQMGYSIWDQIPVVGQVKHLYNAGKDALGGNWKDAGSEAINGLSPTIAEARGFQQGYDDKKNGYESVQASVDRLKKERMKQKDDAFALGMKQYEPTQRAITALYGDPSTWRT